MFVENDYILRQIKQVIRNLAGLLNLQTVFDLLNDYYAELIRIKLQSKGADYLKRLSENSGVELEALNKLIDGQEMLDQEQVALLKAYFGD